MLLTLLAFGWLLCPLTSAQVSHATEDDETDSGITCVGSVPTNFPDEFRLDSDGQPFSLADACLETIRVTCDEQHTPEVLIFDDPIISEAHQYLGQIKQAVTPEQANIPAMQEQDALVGMSVYQTAHFRQQQMMAELCHIKCRCSEFQRPSKEVLQRPAAIGDTYWEHDQTVMEWDFGTSSLAVRPRNDGEQTWWKGGFMSYFRGEVLLRKVFHQYSVGNAGNKPTCGDSLSDYPEVKNTLETVTGRSWDTTQQLCAHRYYGGDNFTSLGGVCLPGDNGKRFLSFPYEHKAPELTIDNFSARTDFNLGSLTLPAVIEMYCHHVCHCDGEENSDSDDAASVAALEEYGEWVSNKRQKCSHENDIKTDSACSWVAKVVRAFPDDDPKLFGKPIGELVPVAQNPPTAYQAGKTLAKPMCSGSCNALKSCAGDCQCLAYSIFVFWMSGACTYQKHVSFHDGLKARDTIDGNVSIPHGDNPISHSTSIFSPSTLSTTGSATFTGGLPMCNDTYISLACANATNGIVHEDPSKQIGALLDLNFKPSRMEPPPVPEYWLKARGFKRDPNFNLSLSSSGHTAPPPSAIGGVN